jgi:parallel beta-helix repeat protein
VKNYEIAIHAVNTLMNSLIEKNEFLNNEQGIRIDADTIEPVYSIKNTIQDNTFTSAGVAGNNAAIFLSFANNNVIQGNSMEGGPFGILATRSSNNKIGGEDLAANIITGTGKGIFIQGNGDSTSGAIQNNITENTIESNLRGIRIDDAPSTNNWVIKNNFVNNVNPSRDKGTGTKFDIGNEGNYWTNFDQPTEGCPDNNLNGVCDNPLTIDANQDHFPFTNPNGWINKWPIFTSTPVTQASVGVAYSYDANAVDPESHTITFSLQGAPSGMTINPTSGLITWVVPLAGKYTIKVKAADTQGAQPIQQFTLNVVCPASPSSPSGMAVMSCYSQRR